jgi:hypothetical protein
MAEEALKMMPNRNGHSIDPRFIKNLKGKDFVLYSGLLDLGHQIGIQSIHVKAIQYPTKDNGNEGICKAIITSVDGRIFTEVGDANPKNVNAQVSAHVLRMAATRAKARALRDMTNIGMTCIEELGDIETVIGTEDPKVIPMKPKNQRSSNDSPKPENSTAKAPGNHPKKTQGTTEANPATEASDAKISTAQRNAILSISKRKGYTEESIINQIKEIFGTEIINLSATQASSFIKNLQAA